MGFFSKLFGGGGGSFPNPANAGMPYLNQIPATVKPYYEPYINEGKEAAGIANPIYGRMAQGPGEFIEALMSKYEPSKGYQFKKDQLTKQLGNTAAAGGFSGTENDQLAQGELVRNLLSQDMQEYLANLLGVQGAGLEGQERRIGRGYQASLGLGDILGSNLGQQAGLASQGAAQQAQFAMDNKASRRARQASIFSALAGLAGTGAGQFGAGGAFAPGGRWG